jgi:hypothetical protein
MIAENKKRLGETKSIEVFDFQGIKKTYVSYVSYMTYMFQK